MHDHGRSSNQRRAPIWQALCEAGLAASEAQARAMVLAGQVLVDDRPVVKPGTPVAPNAALRVRGVRTYASRGGHKLEAALGTFAVDATGRVALDAGASTGGFTDCLLRHGAARVYAVEVGFGQLMGRLRQDPRVVNLERTNLAAVAGLDLRPRASLVTLDLSYLGLADAWHLVAEWLPAGADVISLVKPLFEVDDPEARRTGRIHGQQPYVDVIARLVREAQALGWSVFGVMASPIRGTHNTVEFLMHVRPEPGRTPDLDLPAIVGQALTPADAAVGPPPDPPPANG